MKKVWTILIFALTIVMYGCDKEDKTDPNPYNGTVWTKSYESIFGDEPYMYVIEFTDKDFSYYEADINGNFKKSKADGTYTYEGNEITIKNAKTAYGDIITGATVSGKMLTLHYYWISSSDGSKHESDIEFRKKN